MATKRDASPILKSINIRPVAFVICTCILIAITITSSIVSLALSQNNEQHQNGNITNITQEETQPTIEQVKSADMPGIYGDFTAKIDVTKIAPELASNPANLKAIEEYNQNPQALPSSYFGLVKDGRLVEQISILTPCSSVAAYSVDSNGLLKRDDGKSTKTNAAMSSSNKYAQYGAFLCQSHTVELPINLPNGTKVRPDLGSSYKTKIDEENGKLYMDIEWSILADGTDVYYNSNDYDGYQWTIQDANNKTVRTYLVKLVPMLSDNQQNLLNAWKNMIDVGH